MFNKFSELNFPAFMDYHYRMQKIPFLVLYIFMICLCLSAEKRGGSSFHVLESGEPVQGVIRTRDNGWYDTYRFRITSGTLGVILELEDSPADLDLYLRFGAPMEDYSQADAFSESDRYNEDLKLFRYGETGLENGYAYVDVAYMFESLPVADQKVIRDIPYTLKMTMVEAEPLDPLRAGAVVAGELDPSTFMIRTYPVFIPAKAEWLRVDLFDTTGDLDLMVTHSPVIPSRDHPLYLSETVAGNETVLMEVGEQYRGDTLYISVLDRVSNSRKQSFRIVTGFTPQVPSFLLDLPEWEDASPYEEEVLNATVEIITPDGGGSGTLISPDGLILTNYHVLLDPAGGYFDRVVIAVVDDIFRPAVESFRAKVLEASEERDCALLQIDSGYYDQSLPRGYLFPYYRIGSAEELLPGDEIRVLGFPTIGGSGSRSTLTLSRGILSGGERLEDGFVLKTDAMISGGNSGGAATDSEYRLVGIPSFLMEEDSESIGYVIPLSRVPSGWFSRYLPLDLFPD